LLLVVWAKGSLNDDFLQLLFTFRKKNFMLALLRRASFWTTFYGLFSVIIIHTYLQITFLFHDLDHLWAASMYCIYTCLSDLWVLIHVLAVLLLFLCGLESICFISVIFQSANLEENYLLTLRPATHKGKHSKNQNFKLLGMRQILGQTWYFLIHYLSQWGVLTISILSQPRWLIQNIILKVWMFAVVPNRPQKFSGIFPLTFPALISILKKK
jgi:hypothetical protein